MLFLTSCNFVENTSTIKELLPLISPLIVILLFGIERYLSYKIRKKEREINWYYKAYIDPNLITINDFFNNIKSSYSSSYDNLKTKQKEKNYNDFKSFEIGKFQKDKRNFEVEIILPIISSYPKIGSNLTDIILEIEDLYTEYLDKITSDESYYFEFANNLSIIKSNFYKVLFSQIQKKNIFKKIRPII